jgi:HEAT repeat protein
MLRKEVLHFAPPDDPRTIDELFAAALWESDDDLVWNAIGALHRRGTQEILDRAIQLCSSSCALERRSGADILAQLGSPGSAFPEICMRTLLEMLERESRGDVLNSILMALAHQHRAESVMHAFRFRQHGDADVRYGVVQVLTGQTEPLAVSGLIELTRDPVADIRDWATFGLGTQIDLDTPEIRECLMERLTDPDDNTRCEALVGLAQRRDRRVLPALSRELRSEFVQEIAVEAASLIADPQLYLDLVALQERWVADKQLLEDAIAACSPAQTIASGIEFVL